MAGPGQKKGVAHTYRQIADQIESYSGALGLGEQSRIASWLPLYHDMGLVAALLMPVHVGATVVSVDAFEWVLKPHMLLELMDLPVAVIHRDSGMTAPAKFFSESFRRTVFVATPNTSSMT